MGREVTHAGSSRRSCLEKCIYSHSYQLWKVKCQWFYWHGYMKVNASNAAPNESGGLLSPVHIWPSTGNCSHAFIHRMHRDVIWLPAVSPKEKKRIGLGSQSHWPISWSSQQSCRSKESQRWYAFSKARGESHLPSVAPQLGFVQWQRNSSVLTAQSNCYLSSLSALQKQSASGVNSFHSPHIINCHLNLRNGTTYKMPSTYTWKQVEVKPTPLSL